MSELAVLAEGSLSRLSQVVTRLELKRWVSRTPGPADGRYTLATLTEDGWDKVVATAPGHVAEVRRFVLDPLTKAQTRQLTNIGHRILRAIDVLDLAREAKEHGGARAYVDRVVAAVMPTRDEEPPWFADLDAAIREHCRQRRYRVSGGGSDRFGYWMWKIDVPNREEPVRLSVNGEVVLQTFPGEFTLPEFGYSPQDVEEAVQGQLGLLDSYADPATRTVSVRWALRRPRTELHLSNGTVLWLRGGRRPQT